MAASPTTQYVVCSHRGSGVTTRRTIVPRTSSTSPHAVTTLRSPCCSYMLRVLHLGMDTAEVKRFYRCSDRKKKRNMHGFQGSCILSPYHRAESKAATKGEGRAGEGARGGWGVGGGGGSCTKVDGQRSETLKINKIHVSTTNSVLSAA